MPKTIRGGLKDTKISISKELAEAVDAMIIYGNLGYRSRQEFCAEAIRRFVRDCSRDLESLNKTIERLRGDSKVYRESVKV